MYASLFDYEVNLNAMKALISYWNCPTHTILTRMSEMGISLLDVAEIGGLPIWGEIYDEHLPPLEVVEWNKLLKSLIVVHKHLPLKTPHNHKYYISLVDWAKEFAVDRDFYSNSQDRLLFAIPEDPFECLR